MASQTSHAMCENAASGDEVVGDKSTEVMKNASKNREEASTNPDSGPTGSATLSQSKNALTNRATDVSTATIDGGGDPTASDGEGLKHFEVVTKISSPPNKQVARFRQNDRKTNVDLQTSNTSETSRGKVRCQRSSHRNSRYQEAISRLCSEIDKMASQLRSKVKRELTALENSEHDQSACRCQSSVSGESSFENNHKFAPAMDETSSADMESDSDTMTMSSDAVQCCGCMQHNKSPNQRSKDSSRSSYQPVSLLRHPQKAKLIQKTSSEEAVGGGDDSWYTHLAKIKRTMDEKHEQLRELWSKPIGDCQESDGSAFVSWSSPAARERQISTSLSQL